MLKLGKNAIDHKLAYRYKGLHKPTSSVNLNDALSKKVNTVSNCVSIG